MSWQVGLENPTGELVCAAVNQAVMYIVSVSSCENDFCNKNKEKKNVKRKPEETGCLLWLMKIERARGWNFIFLIFLYFLH